MSTDSDDVRESLANDRRQGPAHAISLPREMITTLHGFIFDIDSNKLAPGNPVLDPVDDPVEFLARLDPLLDRHPVARLAEVRATGGGLHLVCRFDEPVELLSSADQTRWDGVVGLIQLTLPADPECPAMTALTRPVGTVNSKSGRTVRLLRPGQPVRPADVREYARRTSAAPFREVAVIWLGSDQVRPCPVCGRPDSTFKALDRAGHCYACGAVRPETLAGRVYRTPPRPGAGRSARG